jgi:hypothetical protein
MVRMDARTLGDAPGTRRDLQNDIRGTPFNEDATGTERLAARDTELTAAYWGVMVKRALTHVSGPGADTAMPAQDAFFAGR